MMENNTQPNNELPADDLVSENAAEETLNTETSAEIPTEDAIAALQKVQADLAEAKDKYLRLYSEFENFRRRTAREKLDMVQSANEQLLKALLPVVDDFDRAEKSFKSKSDQDAEGFLLIQNKFKKTLDQFGVKIMEIKPGADFNVDQHEAITQVPAPSEKMKGKIVDVVESGYVLNDKVIRFAKVVIGN